MLEETLIKWRDMIRKEALQEGRVQTLRKVLLELMGQRFGRLPQKVQRQIEKITSSQELEKLTRKVLSAKSPQEMGLG